MDLSILPSVNASLNAASTVFLSAGWIFIRRGKIRSHITSMALALVTSSLFLTSYLYYHFHHGRTPFPGHGGIRAVYFVILVSHTILAVVIVPLVLTTLYFALSGRFQRHKRFGRVTLPLWLYVSVTGVVVYWMLYRVHY